VSGEGFGSVIELGGVFVFREAGGVEHLCKLGGFLGCVWAGRWGHGVEIERFEEGPFFIRRHEGVLHQLIESFEALNINPDGVFVAFFCSVEGILLSVAYPPKVAHGSFMFYIRKALSLPLFAHIYPVGSVIGLAMLLCTVS